LCADPELVAFTLYPICQANLRHRDRVDGAYERD
jgi:hypothetical protein